MQLHKNLPKGFHEKWSRIFFVVALILLFSTAVAGGVHQCNREINEETAVIGRFDHSVKENGMICVAVRCDDCFGACDSPDPIIVRTAPNEQSVGFDCYDYDSYSDECDGWVPTGFMRYDAGYRSGDDYDTCVCIQWEHPDYEGTM